MKSIRTWMGALLALASAGCDLPELSQRMDGAVTPPDAAANPPDMSAVPPGDLAQMATTDMAVTDGNGIPLGAMLGSCDPARWTASASDSHALNPPSYAIDGLLPSRWTTGAIQSAGQYIQIDFGGYVMVSGVDLDHGFGSAGKDDYPRGFDVLVSNDGIDFSTNLKTENHDTDPGTITSVFAPHAARFLRLQLNQGAVMAWWSIHELHVNCQVPSHGDGGMPPGDGGVPGLDGGLPDGGVDPGRANWTATANFTNGGEGVAKAFDGNTMTRWADGKAQYGDEWFRLDLGQPFAISQVWLTTSAGDYPSAFELDLSVDDMSYTPVARGLGMDVTRIGFSKQTARYVKIKQIGTGYDHWWTINEIDIVQ